MDKNKLIQLATIHGNCDYSNNRSIKRANQAADEFRAIIKDASVLELDPVFDLVDHPITMAWFAFSVMDLAKPSPEQRDRCLKTIKAIASETGPDSFGAKIWLSKYAPNA